MIVLEIIVAVIALGGILAYMGTKLSKGVGNKATTLIEMLDAHYDSTIEKHKTLLLMENSGEATSAVILSDDAMQRYVEEAFVILKPDIDALIGQINSTSLSDVKIAYEPRYFKNLAFISEALFEKRRKTGEHLSERDEAKLYAAVKEAMLSDLKERALNWKIGNL